MKFSIFIYIKYLPAKSKTSNGHQIKQIYKYGEALEYDLFVFCFYSCSTLILFA